MSIVHDQVRRLDLHVDKFQLSSATSRRASTVSTDTVAAEQIPSPRVTHLKAVIRSLSTTSSSAPQLSSSRLLRLLEDTEYDNSNVDAQEARSDIEEELEWIVVAKAAVQTYGLVMETLLQQLAPISEEIWYWDDILTSYRSTSIYTIQTAPLRVIERAKEVLTDVRTRRNTIDTSSLQETLSSRWQQFYGLARKSISERSLAHARSTVLSPFALCRSEALKKQNGLKRIRELSSCGLGLLVNEGLSFPGTSSNEVGIDSPPINMDEWRSTIEKSVTLMDSILLNVCALDINVNDFEETVFTAVDDESEAFSQQSGPKSQVLVQKLKNVLKLQLPAQIKASDTCFAQYGRPSRVIRYWLPGVVLLLSGSTILRIFASRRAEIVTWIQEFGSTVRDFWFNWVIEPVKKLVGTIRHDETSEVAIMSKDSLKADRESLERMVVEFAADRPENGTAYTPAQMDEISAKVKEGDLTPVLKAYERDLRKPFVGTVRGDLIRALLIQVQKTKVDVEVAIGGIDSLLKSQELVFGFVGLTPGLLVSYAVFRWLGTTLGSRKGGRLHQQQGEAIRTLRNIDRILTSSTLTEDGLLVYKDHGLLLAEANVVRRKALSVLPARIHREFLEDISDLIDVKIGVHRQKEALRRIQWAYGKWLQ